MDVMHYLNENYMFLVPVLWIIGIALKRTPKVPDWMIIWILFFVSLALAVFSFGFTPDAVVNAIIAAGVAVFGHQLVKQTKNK
ncbi:phage holin family protein [Bacillus marinisedimentorum]|uniref:phage holin family protein n=1 Tax=Bacillus marinisedimentorum TaxID=1821260 RepID=UPI000873260F|nr:phage holin family protein [Bacillus marinisedimentorum]